MEDLLDYLSVAALNYRTWLSVTVQMETMHADAENVSKAALSVYNCCVSEDHPAVGTGTIYHALLFIQPLHLHSFTVSHRTGQSGKLLHQAKQI